jgi:acyl-CoA synthetase (AMP-forming)/AMP-acid ligase II
MSWIDALPDLTVGQALTGAVERFGDREVYTFAAVPASRLTFREVDVSSDRVARALLASGVRRGDRIAAWMANHADFPSLYFGAMKIGALLVTLSTRYKPEELAFGLAKSRATTLFWRRERKGSTDYGDVLRAVEPERMAHLRTVVDCAEPPSDGSLGLAAFLARADGVDAAQLARAEAEVRPGDPALVVYTSGTTAFPKGTMLSHVGMLRGAAESSRWLEIEANDVQFSAQPFYHSGGGLGAMLRPIVTGARLVTQPYFEPGDALAAMEAEGVTVLSGHQPHYIEYMNHPTLPQRRLRVERALVIAPPEIFVMVRDKLGITGLTSGYGMTETHMYGTACSLDDPEEVRFNTNGRPNTGVEVEIRDPEDGTRLPGGTPGEIFLRVPHPMIGYFDEPALTAEAIDAGGWYRTGDKGVLRPDGNLCLLGRVRDMIRVGGENLSGAEVEAVLLEHAAIKQAAAVAAPDARLGEVVVAFVELKAGASAAADEIVAHCRTKLAHFKVPTAVHFVNEWPISGAGKLQKRLLLERIR